MQQKSNFNREFLYAVQEMTLQAFERIRDEILTDTDTFIIYDLIQEWAHEFCAQNNQNDDTASYYERIDDFLESRIRKIKENPYL